jgi:hypothetical protein
MCESLGCVMPSAVAALLVSRWLDGPHASQRQHAGVHPVVAPGLQLCFGGGVLLGFVLSPALRHGTWMGVVTLVRHLDDCDLGWCACIWGRGSALSARPCSEQVWQLVGCGMHDKDVRSTGCLKQ